MVWRHRPSTLHYTLVEWPFPPSLPLPASQVPPPSSPSPPSPHKRTHLQVVAQRLGGLCMARGEQLQLQLMLLQGLRGERERGGEASIRAGGGAGGLPSRRPPPLQGCPLSAFCPHLPQGCLVQLPLLLQGDPPPPPPAPHLPQGCLMQLPLLLQSEG